MKLSNKFGKLEAIGEILKECKDINTILDVGCRDGILRQHVSCNIDYFGSDLNDTGSHVNFVGDFQQYEFDRKFSAVIALDVIEHLDTPVNAINKMIHLSDKYVIVSLPNCYDMKYRYNYLIKGHLGGHYVFDNTERLDRHRWVMNYEEICRFYREKAEEFDLELEIVPIKYGTGKLNNLTHFVGLIIAKTFPRHLSTETIIGIFSKK